MPQFYISMKKLAEKAFLNTLYTPAPLEEIQICSSNVNRPGLLLTGYGEHFDPERIQIIGNAETGYLQTLPEEEQKKRWDVLMGHRPPAVILTWGLPAGPGLLEAAEKYGVPVMQSAENTSILMGNLISVLSVELAPRITRHGVFVEVYGEGILIMGDSGVGKSETAIELVKRGHRLIADDAVELRKVSNRTVVGQAPENIRHFVELRGIGVINLARVFGVGAVKVSEKVDLVVELEPWDSSKDYQNLGLEEHTIDIMGIKLPQTCIPIRPGRNLAMILEVAAINNRQKRMGYNAAEDLINRLGMSGAF